MPRFACILYVIARSRTVTLDRCTQLSAFGSVPDQALIAQAILAAQVAGRSAADAELQSLRDRMGEREQYDLAAGAVLHLQVRPTSRLGHDIEAVSRALSHLCHALPGNSRGEMVLAIAGMSARQEQCVNIAAKRLRYRSCDRG